MAQKMIKIKEHVYIRLEELKNEGDSFSDVIQYLINDNENLKSWNDELKKDKEMLMKMVMKTNDSIALPNVNHSTFFALAQVLKNNNVSDDDKVDSLKVFLTPSLEEDSHAVLSIINEFKTEHPSYSNVLNKLTSWIKNEYKK